MLWIIHLIKQFSDLLSLFFSNKEALLSFRSITSIWYKVLKYTSNLCNGMHTRIRVYDAIVVAVGLYNKKTILKRWCYSKYSFLSFRECFLCPYSWTWFVLIMTLSGSAKSLNLLDSSSEYQLTYEDRDGDWMLVGDVPWEMFVGSVKRLKIMRASDANGLG